MFQGNSAYICSIRTDRASLYSSHRFFSLSIGVAMYHLPQPPISILPSPYCVPPSWNRSSNVPSIICRTLTLQKQLQHAHESRFLAPLMKLFIRTRCCCWGVCFGWGRGYELGGCGWGWGSGSSCHCLALEGEQEEEACVVESGLTVMCAGSQENVCFRVTHGGADAKQRVERTRLWPWRAWV